MNKNALKIGAAVLLLAAAAGLLFYNASSAKVLPDSVTYVCVATGKTFSIARGGPPKVLPLENPETHQRTLLPCQKREDGWYLSERIRSDLKALGDANKIVDPQSLRVNIDKK